MSAAYKMIHVAKRELNMDDDDYRELIGRVSKGATKSLKGLSDDQRQELVEEMKRLGFVPQSSNGKLQGAFTGKLVALWLSGWNLGIVSNRNENALIAFVERQTGISHKGLDRGIDNAEVKARRLGSTFDRTTEQGRETARAIGGVGQASDGAAAAMSREAAAANASVPALRNHAQAANLTAEASRKAAFQQKLLLFQLNDIGVSLASGMNPLLVMVQQGSQISQIYGPGEGGVGRALKETGNMIGSLVKRIPLLTAGVKADARNQLATLEQKKALDRQQVDRTYESPLERYRREVGDVGKNLNDSFEDVQVNGLKALSDGLTDVIMGARSLGDVFKQVANQIVADLIRIMIQQLVVKSLMSAIGGGGGGGAAASGIGAAVSSFGSAFGGFAGGFATGGMIPTGMFGIVGERGPEPIISTPRGALVRPNSTLDSSAFRPAANNVSISIPIDATGADPAALGRVRAQLDRLEQSLPGTIVRTMQEAGDRRIVTTRGWR